MKLRNWLICAVVVACIPACSGEEEHDTREGNRQTNTTGGKSDEFVSEEDLCHDSNGTWTDDASDAYYCLCAADQAFVAEQGCLDRGPIRDAGDGTGGTYEEDVDYAYCSCPGDRIVDHGNCLAPDPGEEAACLEAGGLWTDDASDSYYCLCAADEVYVAADGCVARADFQATCEATGGTYEDGEDYALCACGGDRYAEGGNCLAPDPAHEQTCLESGGQWTDDASDSYYCICPDDSEIYDGSPCAG